MIPRQILVKTAFKTILFISVAVMACNTCAADTPAVSDGAVYARSCMSCHQPDGAGVDGVYPALAGDSFVTGPKQAVVKTIIGGRGGMPSFIYYGAAIGVGWSNALTDAQIAAVATFIRSAWGNKASPVSVKDVQKVLAKMPGFAGFGK